MTTTTAAAPLNICPSCGVIALPHHPECPACQSKTHAPLVVHDSARGFWACVECEFTCSVCGNPSPLNYLALDHEVQCLRCGSDVRFDTGGWWDALESAHETADLCGPSPEGRFPTPGETVVTPSNDFGDVGVTRAFVDETGGLNELHLRAAPGHPLCGSCKTPLRGTAHGDSFETLCPSCHEKHSYALPPEVRKNAPGLAGVVDLEHELGGKAATVRAEASGGVALRCPNCAGELEFDGKATIVHCKYCQSAVRVPTHRLHRLGERAPERLRWWLYFTDVSAGRKIYEARARELHTHGARARATATVAPAPRSLWPLARAAIFLLLWPMLAVTGWFLIIRPLAAVLQRLSRPYAVGLEDLLWGTVELAALVAAIWAARRAGPQQPDRTTQGSAPIISWW